MAFINVGVNDLRTKKALKEAVKTDPSGVTFYSTSPLGEQFSGTAAEVPVGTKLTVCGPDPYNDRRWWATVENTPTGVKVS